MVRNRNGYWMYRGFLSPDDGGGTDGAPAENGAGGGENPAGDDENKGSDESGNESDAKALTAQLEQLKADLARQKAALDKATKEAGDARKALKAKMTQEEIDAANKKEAEEKAAQELEELRKKVAKSENTKSVMSKLSVDEDTAGKIAECMVGCEDIGNALLLIQKAWESKEKALKLEYGKIPGPGAGGSNDEDAEEKAAIELARKLGRARADSNKSVADGLKGYMR